MAAESTLRNQVALVTGAGRGIGASIAAGLAHAGAVVAVNDVDAEAAEGVASGLSTEHLVIAVPGRVGDDDATKGIIRRVNDELGPVDILVNNAGCASSGAAVHRTEMSEVEALFRVHALGAFMLSHAVLPSMRSRRYGRIIMISSAITSDPERNGSPYVMAKAALEALAITIAREGERYGVHANIVAPRLVDTRLGRQFLGRLSEGGQAAREPQMLPPQGVADIVVHLVGPQGRYLNGQRLCIGTRAFA